MPKPCMFGKADSAESSYDSINQQNNPLPLTNSEMTEEEINPFVCYRCSKRFSTLFALGGHQNKHKKEREEERRVCMERRLALQKQSSTRNSPMPLTIDPPFNVINSMPFHGPLVQPPQAPVLFVPDARFGPFGPTRTSEVVNGGEGSQNCYHPYRKTVNKQSMVLKLFPHEKRDFGGKASDKEEEEEEDSTCSRYNYSADSSTAATTTPDAAPCADDHQINTSKEELDLTLRL